MLSPSQSGTEPTISSGLGAGLPSVIIEKLAFIFKKQYSGLRWLNGQSLPRRLTIVFHPWNLHSRKEQISTRHPLTSIHRHHGISTQVILKTK